jgi:uncharacterized protein YeaO (DUF488 family)
MKLKRYKEFNEGIFSKVKSIFKSEFERYAEKIDASLKEILKDIKSNFDIKLHKYDNYKSYKSYFWDIQVVGKEDYVKLIFVDNKTNTFRIETHLTGMDADKFPPVITPNIRIFDCSNLVKENQLDFQLKQIISMFIGTLEFIEKKQIFDQEYPLEDIKNWTYGLSDMDGLNLKLYKLGPNFIKINDKAGWTKAGKPGYLVKVWIEKESNEWKSFEEDFKNEIEMLKKQLSNVGLKLKVNGGTTQHKGEIVSHEQTFVIQKL